MSLPDSRTESAHLSPTRSRTAVVAVCWALVLLGGIDTFVYGSALPTMIGGHELGITDASAGTIGSYSTFGMLVGTIVAGTVTNWIGRRPTVFVSVAVFAAATLGSGLATGAGMFGAFRLVCGLGLGGLLPIAISYGMEFTTGARKALATGLIMSAHQVGGAVAPLIALALLGVGGWRSVFVASAVPAVVLLPIAAALLPESPATLLTLRRPVRSAQVAASYGLPAATPKPRQTDRLESLKSLFRGSQWATTLCFWLTSFAGLMLVYGVGQWLPKIMGDLGYETGDSLLFSTALNVGGIVGMFVGGRLSDAIGPRRIVIAWFALTAVFVYLLGAGLPVALLYVVAFFAGMLLFSGQTMVYATVGTHHEEADRATALGWVAGVGRFGAVFGPWLGGVLLAAGQARFGFTAFAAAGRSAR